MREVAGQEVHDTPTLRTPDIHKLQFSLMREEAIELYAAEIDQDRVAIADALGDLLYVVYNTANAHGIVLDRTSRVLHDVGSAIGYYQDHARAGNIEWVELCLTNIKTAIFIRSEGYIPLRLVFAEIHRSNMTKLWTMDEVEEIAFDSSYTYEFVESKTDRVYRVKNKLGKLIKSKSFSPPNLAPILEAYSK